MKQNNEMEDGFWLKNHSVLFQKFISCCPYSSPCSAGAEDTDYIILTAVV